MLHKWRPPYSVPSEFIDSRNLDAGRWLAQPVPSAARRASPATAAGEMSVSSSCRPCRRPHPRPGYRSARARRLRVTRACVACSACRGKRQPRSRRLKRRPAPAPEAVAGWPAEAVAGWPAQAVAGWPGVPRRPRASRHAPGEARQPSSAACQGGMLVPRRVARGTLSLLAHPPPLEIGSCERLSERLRPPGSLTSSSEGLCPAAAGCGAGLLPEERIWWSTCMAPASEPGVRLSCRLIVCSLAAGVSPKA